MISRERGILLTLTALALGGSGILALHTAAAAQIPPVGIHRSVSAGVDGVTRIQFLGDTMLGDGAEDVVTADPFRLTASMVGFADGDVTIANAEGPITARQPATGLGTRAYSYASQPKVAAVLGATGVDVVSLANNHSMDVGLEGLRDTQKYLADAGLLSWGAGANATEAEVPLLLETPNGTIGIVAIGEDFGSDRRATATTAGTLPTTAQRVQRGVELARAAGADLIVAFVHWGDNYQPINDEQRAVARLLIDAGYQMIIGHGPHVAQPVEVIDGVPIAWSLGNFIFTSPGRYESYSAEGFGLSLTLVVAADGSIQFDWRCLVTDNLVTGYQARPCTAPETLHVLPFLNSSLTVAGTTGTMPSPLRLKPIQGYAAPPQTPSVTSQ